MRILFISALKITDVCGVISHIKTLGKGMQELGHEVDYLTLSSIPKPLRKIVLSAPSFLIRKISPNMSQVWYYTLIKLVFAFIFFIKHLRKRYDMVIAQDYVVCNSIQYIKKIFKIPILYTVHSYVSDALIGLNIRKGSFAERFFVSMDKKSYEIADKIITVDSRLKSHIIDTYNTAQDKIEVKVNFVDINEFKPRDRKTEFREMFGIPKKKFVILCPRRLAEKNGVIYAASAVKFLRNLMAKDFIIVFVGSNGLETEKIKKIVKANQTENHILMLPVIPYSEMRYLYNAADLVIIPSIHLGDLEEATSISALEAMASGVPVIASNIGGLKEIIEDRTTGFLVEEKKPEELAEKIVQASSLDTKQITENARNFVVKNCSHIKRAQEYLDCCLKMLDWKKSQKANKDIVT